MIILMSHPSAITRKLLMFMLILASQVRSGLGLQWKLLQQ